MQKPKKIRLDHLMVQQGLTESRESAQRLILAGKVLIEEKPALKSAQLVRTDAEVRILEPLKYASRGGVKLEKALEAFQIDVSGKVGLDLGASTGGFTDCLLQHNAKHVYAVDVGYGQFSWKLRHDPRVTVMERTNARFLTPNLFPQSIDLAVIDVSFISALKILEPLETITDEAVVLLKPQFEAGPGDVPRGGVIQDASTHEKVLVSFFRQIQEWQVHDLIESPLRGGSGNREFFVHLKKTWKGQGWDELRLLKRIEEIIG